VAEQKRILISLSDSLLGEVDSFSKSLGISRSELVRKAMKEYMSRRRAQEINKKLAEGYSQMAKINQEWAEMCFDADNETQQNYEEKLSESE